MSGPQRIGPYRVEGVLGAGGMGQVYLARDPESGAELAIKVLLGHARLADGPKRRFLREVRALEGLRHPGLVRFVASGQERGVPWLATERVPGVSLEERIAHQGTLSPAEATELGLQLCAAIGAAHDRGLLHRDLKPENVLCDTSGARPRYVVTDFGLAKDLSREDSVRLSQTGTLQGTPGYWAPEQAEGQGSHASLQTDVYGLGAVLYAALSGCPPIQGAHLLEVVVATRTQPPAPLASFGVEAGPLEAVVLRCLAKGPGERYADLDELAAALRASLEASTSRGQGVSPAWFVLPLATIAGAATAAALYLSTQDTPAESGPPAPVALGTSPRATSTPAPTSPTSSPSAPPSAPPVSALASATPSATSPPHDWAAAHEALASDLSPEGFERRIELLEAELRDPGVDGTVWATRHRDALLLFERSFGGGRQDNRIASLVIRLAAIHDPYQGELFTRERLRVLVREARRASQDSTPAARGIQRVLPWLELRLWRVEERAQRDPRPFVEAWTRAFERGEVSPFWRALALLGAARSSEEALARIVEAEEQASTPDEVAWIRLQRAALSPPQAAGLEQSEPLYQAALRRAESPLIRVKALVAYAGALTYDGQAEEALALLARADERLLFPADRAALALMRLLANVRAGRLEAARTALARLGEEPYTNTRLQVTRGALVVELSLLLGDLSGARAAYRGLRLAALEPTDRIRLHALLGESAAAAEQLERYGDREAFGKRTELLDVLLRTRARSWPGKGEDGFGALLERERVRLRGARTLAITALLQTGRWGRALRLARFLFQTSEANQYVTLLADGVATAREQGAPFARHEAWSRELLAAARAAEVPDPTRALFEVQLHAWRGETSAELAEALRARIDPGFDTFPRWWPGYRALLELASWQARAREPCAQAFADEVLSDWQRNESASTDLALERLRWRPDAERIREVQRRLEDPQGSSTYYRVEAVSLLLRPLPAGPAVAPRHLIQVIGDKICKRDARRRLLIRLAELRARDQGSAPRAPERLLELAEDWAPPAASDPALHGAWAEAHLRRGERELALARVRRGLEAAALERGEVEGELRALEARILRERGGPEPEWRALEARALALPRTSRTWAHLARGSPRGSAEQTRRFALALGFPLHEDERAQLVAEVQAAGVDLAEVYEVAATALGARVAWGEARLLGERIASAIAPERAPLAREIRARAWLQVLRNAAEQGLPLPATERAAAAIRELEPRLRRLCEVQLAIFQARQTLRATGDRRGLVAPLSRLDAAAAALPQEVRDRFWSPWDRASARVELGTPDEVATATAILQAWVARGSATAHVALTFCVLKASRGGDLIASLKAADQALAQARELDVVPHVAEVQRLRATLLFPLARYEETVSACLEARGRLRGSGLESSNLARLSMACEVLGRDEERLGAVRDGLRWARSATPLHQLRMLALLVRAGEDAEAKAALRGIEIFYGAIRGGTPSTRRSSEAALLLARAAMLRRVGDVQGALRALDRALQLAPQTVGLFEELLLAQTARGDLAAFRVYAERIRQDPALSPHQRRALAEVEETLRERAR